MGEGGGFWRDRGLRVNHAVRLRRCRRDAEVSRRATARRAGVSRLRLALAEWGLRDLTVLEVLSVAEALNVEPGLLLPGAEGQ